ncbi:unnamed protein product [Alopecurus aequalis]
MALSSSSSSLLRRLLGSTPLSSSSSLVLRAAFCSSGSFPNLPPPSSIFGDDTEVTNVPPLTTPKLFVSGLSRLTTDEKLKSAFAPFGQVLEGKACFTSKVFVNVHSSSQLAVTCLSPCAAKVIADRVSGRSKGFGFVRYGSLEEAETARQGMNAKFLDGWVIFVDPAKPREQKPAPQPDTTSSYTGFTTNKTVGWCG